MVENTPKSPQKRAYPKFFERSIPIYLALADISFPIDIVVYTTEEINEWSEVQEAFVTRIIREGKILYEKDAS